jgi:WD40 repeat protein
MAFWARLSCPDGVHVVSGSRDNSIRMWDAEIGAAIQEPIKGHNDDVWSVDFPPDPYRK